MKKTNFRAESDDNITRFNILGSALTFQTFHVNI